MVLLDRVACNFCGAFIGQLWDQSAPAGHLLEDQTIPPHFTLCPDCLDASEPVLLLACEAA